MPSGTLFIKEVLMDQLAMLWQYQVEDRKADKLEQELSRSPLRQKMNTCRMFNSKIY